jgi:PAS domain S-box-containing protein
MLPRGDQGEPQLALLPLIIGLLYVGALAVLAKVLPWPLFVAAGALLALTPIYLNERRKRTRYRALTESMRANRIEGFPVLTSLGNRSTDDVMIEGLKDLAAELEKKCYQLVEKNIQLLSLKEISLTIISSLNEARIVDSVRSFLAQGLGFKEIFVGIFSPEIEALRVYTFREAFSESSRHDHLLRVEELDGLLRKSMITRKSILIRDPDMHPIGTLDGSQIFADSTMHSYLVVPMLKSKFSQNCWKAADCILKNESWTAESAALQFCPACGRLPVLGVIGVTDGFKAASLSQVDLVAVETLALQISTLLENSYLYAELKKEETFRENVINSMMNGLITVDIGGSILLANQAAEQLTGYSAGELKGMSSGKLIQDAMGDRGPGPLVRTLHERKISYQSEAWLVPKDGQKRPIALNTSLLLDEEKRVQGVLGVFMDITRIKRMEEKIQHLDKLAALGRFSSSMAHEIRNPLTGIVAGIQYLKRIGSIADDQSENVTFILNEVNRIDRLISDILNVVKPGDLLQRPSQIESVIKGAVTSIRDIADRKSVRITSKLPAHTRPVTIDADRVAQVMINLLKNAVEASHEGGEVRVKVSFPMDTNDVLFDDARNLVIIEVADDGHGFSEADKSKIFEPFFTTKSDGTGLGLYVTHGIVEQHGGYILVDSAEGRGTVFTIYLPVEKVQHGDSSEFSHPLGR